MIVPCRGTRATRGSIPPSVARHFIVDPPAGSVLYVEFYIPSSVLVILRDARGRDNKTPFVVCTSIVSRNIGKLWRLVHMWSLLKFSRSR